MKHKVNVTFEMEFDASKDGKIDTTIRFELPEHPEHILPPPFRMKLLHEVLFIAGKVIDADVTEGHLNLVDAQESEPK